MNKKKISIFIISASIIGGINFADKPVYAVENPASAPTAKISVASIASKGEVINVSSNLNIRESAGTNYSIVGYLIGGQQFNIKGKTEDWYNIEFNGKVGFIHKDYVKELNADAPTKPVEPKPSEKPVEKPSETASSKGEVINVSSNLRMRSSASTSASVVGYLNSGEKFDIKGKTSDWYLIEFNGKTGYVHKDYVKELNADAPTKPVEPKPSEKPVEKPSETASSKGEVINVSSNLRMRSSASTSASVVGYLNSGKKFDIKGKTSDWYLIEFNGKTGYVHKDYVKELNADAPTKPVEPKPSEKPVESPSETASSKGEVINVSSNLRMRSSASTSASVVGYLNSGEKFDIKGKTSDWYLIEFNGKTGYVHKDYVKELNADAPTKPVEPKPSEKPVEKPSETASSKGEVINVSSNLRMRSSASTSASVVGYLNSGEKFDIKGKTSDWYLIEFNGKTGYVHKDYVKELNADAPTKPVEPKPSEKPVEKPSETASSKGEVINVSSNLRMRQEPNTSSAIVSYLIGGQKFNINSKSGDWYFIECDNKVGYIHKDYAKVLGSEVPDVTPTKPTTPAIPGEKLENLGMGMIYNVSTNLRLRSKPSTSDDSQVLAYILPGETCNIIGTAGEWYKVTYAGKTGYVNKDYVKKVNSTEVKDPAGHANVYNIALNAMKAQIGSPYVWGGSGEFLTTASLNSLILRFPDDARRGKYDIPGKYIDAGYRAFDCSGLMQWGFRQAGVSIGRTTWDQVTNGVEVSKANVKPGDMLFFSNLNHVGMYIGDGKWIESPNTRNFIRIADVPWYKIGRIRRVI
ncbi:SH3 domain-containing protein [Clostridium algidicarnis]|uniref:C40 family peptidase n=1 Tax=Clostridium algidicarnis TaxID=37659 RepID=UPI00068C62A9|nr:SH3 domain-containing protein [Clostridium algidicarnis]